MTNLLAPFKWLIVLKYGFRFNYFISKFYTDSVRTIKHHSNNTCKNILRVKLLSVNSTFAANYQYLSYKYGLIEADWFTPLGHLLGKVKKKMLLLHPHPVLRGIFKELCGIRDNTSSCDIANNNDIVALINDICTSN